MNNILKILDDLVLSINQSKQEIAASISVYNSNLVKLEKWESELKAQSSLLYERQQKTSKIESVVKLNQDAKDMVVEAEKQRTINSEERGRLVNEKKELSTEKQKVANDKELVKNDNALVSKMTNELEERKKNLKDEVLKELVNKAK